MIKLSFFNLFRRKTRTALALLGIVIGVAAMTSMVSVVDGMYLEFSEVISQFQGVMVLEKDSMDQVFSQVDASFGSKIESINGVNVAVPEIWHLPSEIDGDSLGVGGMMTLSPIMVYGMDMDKYNKMRGGGWIVRIDRGSAITSNDKGQVVLGDKLADDYDKFVGSTIKLEGKKFRIKGIFEAESAMMEGIVVMNLSDAREISGFDEDKVSSFTVDLIDPAQDGKIASMINFRFGDDLEATTSSDLSEQFGDILGDFRLLVFLVAGISAVVAGIGIINTILMSVLERTREIGALKAVGWTNSNVMRMILYESIFIGIMGGVIGIILGIIVSHLFESAVGLNTEVTIWLILQAFMFALFVGLIAGIYPAIRAAKMNPAEAVRGG